MGGLNSGAANGKFGASRNAPVIPEVASFAEVRETKKQKLEADSRLRENESKTRRISESLALRRAGVRKPAPILDRAQATLRGEPVSIAPTYRDEDLMAAREEHEVLAAACTIANDAHRKAMGQASIQVCEQLSTAHGELEKEIARCAIALYQAMRAEHELCNAIRAKGFEITPPIAGRPVLAIRLGTPDDQNSVLFHFLTALREKGIEL
jgi:hypothetical protein